MWNRMVSRLNDWASLSVIRAQWGLKRLEAKARDPRGAITIEYILIIALIASACSGSATPSTSSTTAPNSTTTSGPVGSLAPASAFETGFVSAAPNQPHC